MRGRGGVGVATPKGWSEGGATGQRGRGLARVGAVSPCACASGED